MTISVANPTTGRFSVVENPNLAPGVCCVCRTDGAPGKLFVDFGMQLDWYGSVYFCFECVRELCGAIGYVPAKELEDAYVKVKLYSELLSGSEERVKTIRESAYGLFRDCNCTLGNGVPDVLEAALESVPVSKPVARKPDKASG